MQGLKFLPGLLFISENRILCDFYNYFVVTLRILSYDLYMKKPLNISFNDELFCREVAKIKDPTLAFMNLYPEHTDKKIASAIVKNKICNSAAIRDRISELLDKQGLSLLDANIRLKRLLDANKAIVLNNEIVDYPDNGIRLAALEKVYKLHGLLKNEQTIDNRSVKIEISEPDVEGRKKLANILDELTALHSKMDLAKNRVLTQPIDV